MNKIITDPVNINLPLTAFIDAQAEMFRAAVVAFYELSTYSLSHLHTQIMISDRISAAILRLVEFVDAELLAAVEDVAVKSAALSRAGFDFDQVYPDGSGDSVGKAILRIAENFAPLSVTTTRADVEADFNEIFNPSDLKQDEAGQTLFSKTLDFAVSAASLNALVLSRQTPIVP